MLKVVVSTVPCLFDRQDDPDLAEIIENVEGDNSEHDRRDDGQGGQREQRAYEHEADRILGHVVLATGEHGNGGHGRQSGDDRNHQHHVMGDRQLRQCAGQRGQ